MFMIHDQVRPFHDPSLGKHDELVGMDPSDDLNSDVMLPAVPDELGLEPGIAPQLGETAGPLSGLVSHGSPTSVVRRAGNHDRDGDQQAIGSPVATEAGIVFMASRRQYAIVSGSLGTSWNSVLLNSVYAASRKPAARWP